MKNILFLSVLPFDPSCGGVERVTDKLCRGLMSLGYNCFYLCFPAHKKINTNQLAIRQDYFPDNDYKSEINIKYFRTYLKTNKINILINQNGLYEASSLFLNVGDNACLKISVLHNDPLGTYNHLWYDLNTAKQPGNIDKIKRIIRCILYPKLKLQIYLSIKKHFKYLKAHTDYIVTLSENYNASLKKIDPTLQSIAIAIPNPNTYDETHSINYSIKENIVLYVGRIDEHQKKISRLIKIWAQIYSIYPDWHLYIIGDGKDKNKLKNIARDLPRIKFIDKCEPSSYYKKARIICLTSAFEGFGMCLTEGMQFGCVPIVFNCYPAVTDIIKNGYSGEIISAFNMEEYKNKLSRLMHNYRYWKYLSQNAFMDVKKFDIKNILPKWINIFEQ